MTKNKRVKGARASADMPDVNFEYADAFEDIDPSNPCFDRILQFEALPPPQYGQYIPRVARYQP